MTIGDSDSTRGRAWSDDRQIVFGVAVGELLQVPASGGKPSPLTRINASRGEAAHRFPQILPGGRFLYWAFADRPENVGVYVAPIAKPDERVFLLRTKPRLSSHLAETEGTTCCGCATARCSPRSSTQAL